MFISSVFSKRCLNNDNYRLIILVILLNAMRRVGKWKVVVVLTRGELGEEGGGRPISCLLGPVYQFSRISEPRNNPVLYCSVVLSIHDFEDLLRKSLHRWFKVIEQKI